MNNNYFKQSKIIPSLTSKILKEEILPYIHNDLCGDLFIEENFTAQITSENGKIVRNSKSLSSGFSVRKVNNEELVYLLGSTDVSLENILNYVQKLYTISGEKVPISQENFSIYTTREFDVLKAKKEFIENKTCDFIMKIYEYMKNKDYIQNIIINIVCGKNHREIYSEALKVTEKYRVMWSLNINITLKKDNKYEVFYKSISSQKGFGFLEEKWQELADFVWNGANDLLNAIEIEAGTKIIVCAPGESGTMLHEAVGHALESDFLTTNNSCFSGKQGKIIGNQCVTVIDDGDIEGVRGTIEYDDEGTKAQHNILIKNGVFTGELSDKINSKKQNMNSSGNGRRESFAHNVIPRMTNTYLAAGSSLLQEMIGKIKEGIFVKDIGGGQVDISTGSFVFAARLAYLIEDGKITSPIKGVMLMGNATRALHDIIEVGNDLSLCNGSGSCGKNGQMVPVCVGCPSFTLQNITVGGK
jgi:TldD protein